MEVTYIGAGRYIALHGDYRARLRTTDDGLELLGLVTHKTAYIFKSVGMAVMLDWFESGPVGEYTLVVLGNQDVRIPELVTTHRPVFKLLFEHLKCKQLILRDYRLTNNPHERRSSL